MINVEVFYSPSAHEIVKVALTLPLGSSIEDALLKSKLDLSYPEIKTLAVGIFSKKKPLSTVLTTGDRIEIYRPIIDPKEKRRRRAKAS